MGGHDHPVHFRTGAEPAWRQVPEQGGFHGEVMRVLAVQRRDYFSLVADRLLLGKGSELGEAAQAALVKKSAGSPWA